MKPWNVDNRTTPRLRARYALCIAAFALTSCAPSLKYPLRQDAIRMASRPLSFRVGVATLRDKREKIERDFEYRKELLGDEAYLYTEDASFGVSDLPAAISDQLARHLGYAGSFREIDRVEMPGKLSRKQVALEVRQFAGEFDAILVGDIVHFYGYDEGRPPRLIETNVEIENLALLSTRTGAPVFTGKIAVKVQERQSERKGNQYSHAIDAFRRGANDLVAQLNRSQMR